MVVWKNHQKEPPLLSDSRCQSFMTHMWKHVGFILNVKLGSTTSSKKASLTAPTSYKSKIVGITDADRDIHTHIQACYVCVCL